MEKKNLRHSVKHLQRQNICLRNMKLIKRFKAFKKNAILNLETASNKCLLKWPGYKVILIFNTSNHSSKFNSKKAITTFITGGNPVGGLLANRVAWLMS